MVADAGILRAMAFPAGLRFVFESKILRLCVRCLLELDDQIVAFTFRQPGLAHQGLAFLLEIYLLLSAFGFGDDCHGLVGGWDGLERRVVKVNRDGLVFLHEEFGVGAGLFEKTTALGAALLVSGVDGEERATKCGNQDSEMF